MPPAARPSPRSDQFALYRLVPLLGVGIFIFLVFAPILALVWETAIKVAHDPALLRLAVPEGRKLPLFARTIALAGIASAGAILLGAILATFLWRFRAGRLGVLRWLIVALAPLPAYVQALAWMTFRSESDKVFRAFTGANLPVNGFMMACWVSLMAMLPFAVALALLATESVPRAQIEAAQLYRRDLGVLFRVVLPLSAPLLAMGGALIFLITLFDYSVPSLFQINVYALQIFTSFNEQREPAHALLTSLPVLAIAMLVAIGLASTLRRVMQAPPRHDQPLTRPTAWPVWFRGLQGLAIVLLILQIGVPLVSMLALVGTFSQFTQTIATAQDDILYSFGVAVLATIVALPLALAVAHALDARSWRGRVMWGLVTFPLAFPASLVGIGLIVVFNQAWLPLQGTPVMPIIAGIVRFSPLMALLLYAQRQRLDRDLLDAAGIFESDPLAGWLRIRLPLMTPGLLGAACLGFALTLGELGATLLVAPAGQSTLTMRIYNFLHYGASESVAALCLVMVLAAVVAGVVGAGLLGAAGGAGSASD